MGEVRRSQAKSDHWSDAAATAAGWPKAAISILTSGRCRGFLCSVKRADESILI
jgi:hypothetical protein